MGDVTVWVAVFLFGLIGLNWPVLEVFHDAPFLYLLVFWLLFVALVAGVGRAEKGPPR